MLADKDYESIVDMMIPYAKEFVCVTPNSTRALPAEELANFIKSKGVDAVAAENIPDGIALAIRRSTGYVFSKTGLQYLGRWLTAQARLGRVSKSSSNGTATYLVRELKET